MVVGASQLIIPSTKPSRAFGDEGSIITVGVFPDRRRIVTGSADNTVRLWDLKDGVVLREMGGHHNRVQTLAVSRDGGLIASGDWSGELIAWDGDTGESLTRAIKAHSTYIDSAAFSPDGTVLATGSRDGTTKLWSTKTWRLQGKPIHCSAAVTCVRYSPSGGLLAITTDEDIQIRKPERNSRFTYRHKEKGCISKFKAHAAIKGAYNLSLAWTPDGTRLLSGGSLADPTIREWDSSPWKQVGHPWNAHNNQINAITVNTDGTLVASASIDDNVRLWRLSDRQTISVFKHSAAVWCVTFPTDGERLFSAGHDGGVSEWLAADAALLDTPREQASNMVCLL